MGQQDTQVRQYCDGCYSAAEKAGRVVKQTAVGQYCGLCEGRVRNGLLHYCPSNGSEFDHIVSKCDRCRHFDGGGLSDSRVKACAHGVLDKLLNGMGSESDSLTFWFDPADVQLVDGLFFDCKRFTDRNDPNGELRDPPQPDCEGQMFFGELLTVRERVPSAPKAAVARR